jgi:hypothetical protein
VSSLLYLATNKLIQRIENMNAKLTRGRTEKGEESPTSPAVKEAAGVWILNPIFLSMKASPLSNMI